MEDQGVYGRITLKWLWRTIYEDLEYIDLIHEQEPSDILQ